MRAAARRRITAVVRALPHAQGPLTVIEADALREGFVQEQGGTPVRGYRVLLQGVETRLVLQALPSPGDHSL